MKCVVTGVAGFIGSHLTERLLGEGHEVFGVDRFLENYPRPFKESNLARLMGSSQFQFIEGDLMEIEVAKLLRGASYVFHLAAQPGVRTSWGREFSQYSHNNILATQFLLEHCKGLQIQKFVYASSSSVYGDTEDLPIREEGLTRPVSPYGVSKLAAEHLCYLYWKAYQVPTVSLRYFTVYGPRQRPDMFFHIFMRSLLRNEKFSLYDDGEQSRDFTFCADIVEGTLAAAFYPGAGEIFNLGGGDQITILEAVKLVEKISGKKARIEQLDRQKGDVKHTRAEIARAKEKLGFAPRVGLEDGLAQEWAWMRDNVKA